MQNVAAARGQSAVRDHGIELLQFGLELFIDQQQRFQRAADIAVAGRDDLVGGGLAWIGNHLKALRCPLGIMAVAAPRSCGLRGQARRRVVAGSAPSDGKSADGDYMQTDDGCMKSRAAGFPTLRKSLIVLLFLLVAPITLSTVKYLLGDRSVDWQTADRSSAGLLPPPSEHPDALVRVYAAR